MRAFVLAGIAAVLASAGASQEKPTIAIPVPENSTDDTIVALASTVRPSSRQLAWQATGCNAFVHFGMNTFSDREWGDGTEQPASFAPSEFDANQWASTFQAAGMKGVVLTCKHHDGFCLWPSKTTEHDVAASAFRNGKGDVVAEVALACRQHGLAFGIYLSPWDRNQECFGTKAYEAVFLAQLTELLSNYGELFEVWFDGAHCPPDDPSLFDWQAVFQLVRKLQPNAVIAITGPDVRWVGNEAGKTRESEWSVLPLPQVAPGAFEQDRQSWRSLWQLRERNQTSDLGSRAALHDAKALCWWPAETDVSIRPGWFYHAHDDSRVKSLDTLLDYWFAAVGGNAVLLLNVPPDRRGLLAEPDVQVLQNLGRYLSKTFATDLTQTSGAHLLPATHKHTATVRFNTATTIDLVELAEDVATAGQQVESFRIDVLQDGTWRECARGTTIGFRRLLRTKPITGTAFRYILTAQRGPATIKTFSLYKRPQLLTAPRIQRSVRGTVTIDADNLPVRYTTDGSAVGDGAARYKGPFELPNGGTVRACTIAPGDNSVLMLNTAAETTVTFGLAKQNWKIVACSSEEGDDESAVHAIDGDPSTHWHSRYTPDTAKPPHYLTIDLGQSHALTGFLYQPRVGGGNGTIADYELHGSNDGKQWLKLAKDTFGNIANNPVQRTVRFAQTTQPLRFVRLTALREANGKPWASIAELGLLVQ